MGSGKGPQRMANYKISPEAEDDLYRIWLYGLEHWGVNAADSYISDLFARFQRIADNPMQFPDVEEIRTGYRRCARGKESIYFRCTHDAVEIMAVIGKQDF